MVCHHRTRVSALLGALLAWVTVQLVCGAMVRDLPVSECDMPVTACCDHDKPKPACPMAGACGVTCTAMLTVQLSETELIVTPVVTTERFQEADLQARAWRAEPIVPPPRATA